jgi:hypothetical protein
MATAKLWLYYRPGTPPQGENVRNVLKQGVGEYQVLFEHPIANGLYACVASSTAGYVVITQNTSDSVTLLNNNQAGQQIDSEVFLIIYAH